MAGIHLLLLLLLHLVADVHFLLLLLHLVADVHLLLLHLVAVC